MRASRTDLFFRALDRPDRTADYCLNVELAPLPMGPEALVAALERGRDAALVAFPKAGLAIRGRSWRPARRVPVELVRGPAAGAAEALHDFVRPPLAEDTSLLQRVYAVDGSGALFFYSRFHHSLADGVGGYMFLEAQLGVALGRLEPPSDPAPEARRKHHPAPEPRSPWLPPVPTTRLAPAEAIGGGRRLVIGRLAAAPLRAFAERSAGRFTYNDVLLALAAEGVRRWSHRPAGDYHPELLVPMNVREAPFEGFANASAIVPIFPDGGTDRSFEERCALIREQMRHAREHGRWYRRPEGLLFQLFPVSLFRRLVQKYGGRTAGTLPFSSLERQSARDWGELFPEVRGLSILSPMMNFPMMIAAVTQGDETRLCLTHYEAPFSAAAVAELVEHFHQVAAELRATPAAGESRPSPAPSPSSSAG